MNKAKFLLQFKNGAERINTEKNIIQIFHESDGLFSVEMRIPAGVCVGKHKHTYSHLSFLAKGIVDVYVDSEPPVRVSAPYCTNIEKGKFHKIAAITEAVWFCTHATDERIIDE